MPNDCGIMFKKWRAQYMDKINQSMTNYTILPSDRGKGARYNENKTPFDLLPLYFIPPTIDSLQFTPMQHDALTCFKCIAEFQKTRNESHLDDAMFALKSYWKNSADVFGYGASKYTPWNWVKGMSWSTVIGCIARHSFAIFDGEYNDPESNLPHVGHLLCNVIMLKLYCTTYPEGNDLPPVDFNV